MRKSKRSAVLVKNIVKGVVNTKLSEANLASQYETAIRKLANELWNGRIGPVTFETLMLVEISLGLKKAWEQGAKEVGIRPEELSPNELAALDAAVQSEMAFVPGFRQFIQTNSRENGGRWRAVSNRVKLWGRRYIDVRNRARMIAETDPKLMWTIGRTEKHCRSCKALDGKVKRASYWLEHGVQPQSPPNEKLECGGHFCDCQLLPTDEPLSKGPLPKLP